MATASPPVFPPWLTPARRFLPFSLHLREKFAGLKVHKVSIDAGFTCPNLDGTAGRGGCSFCANESFSPPARLPPAPVAEQVREGILALRRLRNADRFLAYFQAFTNTYAPVERLRALYDEALFAHPDVAGLCVGTRPDAVPDPVLDLLESYARRRPVTVEFGLQTANEETLRAVGRGHGLAAFEDAMERSRGRGFSIGVHVILGLPGETREDDQRTAEYLSRFAFDSIKVHHFYVALGTKMERDWREGKITLFDLPGWVQAAASFLERIPPGVAVERVCGETHGDYCLAPRFGLRAPEIHRRVHEELGRRGTWQGCRK